MSQISQLSISLSVLLSLHWPSLLVIHPPPTLPQLPPFLNNRTCCLDTFVTKAHFFHFLLHQTQSKPDGNVCEKAWQTLFTLSARDGGLESHMTWLESDSSSKFEDFRFTWLTLMKDSTWLWLGIHNLRLDLDLTQMTWKSWLFFLFFCAYWALSHCITQCMQAWVNLARGAMPESNILSCQNVQYGTVQGWY